jgi:hypothetical protein
MPLFGILRKQGENHLMDLSGRPKAELAELLINLASSIKEEDLKDPATFAMVAQLLSVLDPKPKPLPPELVSQLKDIVSPKDKFAAAAQALGLVNEGDLKSLSESMKAEGLLKSNLSKGAMRRIAPYNPHEMDGRQEESVAYWQGTATRHEGETPGDIREEINKERGPARTRFLHNLHAATKSRMAPDGKREFLLHRGMGVREVRGAVEDGHVAHGDATSWTPKPGIAARFKGRGGQVASAWIHEDNIRTVPKQYGRLGSPETRYYLAEERKKPKGQNQFYDEHEVVVGPHKSRLADPKDLSPEPSIDEKIAKRGKTEADRRQGKLTLADFPDIAGSSPKGKMMKNEKFRDLIVSLKKSGLTDMAKRLEKSGRHGELMKSLSVLQGEELAKADEAFEASKSQGSYAAAYHERSKERLAKIMEKHPKIVDELKDKLGKLKGTGGPEAKKSRDSIKNSIKFFDNVKDFHEHAVDVSRKAKELIAAPGSPKLTVGSTSGKMIKSGLASFDLPAAHTCPGKGACLNWCYAWNGRFTNMPKAIANQTNNWASSEKDDFAPRMIEKLKDQKHGAAVRLHASGDFYNQDYVNKWAQIAKAHPDKQFYAYTKSHHLDMSGLHSLPNFKVIQSEGGKFDSAIDHSKPHSRVFNSLEEMQAAGYTNATDDDMVAANPKVTKIGLLNHGQAKKQFKGTSTAPKAGPVAPTPASEPDGEKLAASEPARAKMRAHGSIVYTVDTSGMKDIYGEHPLQGGEIGHSKCYTMDQPDYCESFHEGEK